MTVGFTLVEGDLLESDDRYIVHQCNCVTRTAGGIAKVIFARFPWADVYSERDGRPGFRPGQRPGEIIVRGDGEGQRFVINLFGQINGGGPRDRGDEDSENARRRMFLDGLFKISKIGDDLHSIGFPWCIGCGIAGGDWGGFYEPAINRFADFLSDRFGTIVRVYRLPGTT